VPHKEKVTMKTAKAVVLCVALLVTALCFASTTKDVKHGQSPPTHTTMDASTSVHPDLTLQPLVLHVNASYRAEKQRAVHIATIDAESREAVTAAKFQLWRTGKHRMSLSTVNAISAASTGVRGKRRLWAYGQAVHPSGV
jgi:hypothetical protein